MHKSSRSLLYDASLDVESTQYRHRDVRGVHTLSELAARFKVDPTLIGQWKKQLLENAPQLFERGHSGGMPDEERLTAPLYQEIGRLLSAVTGIDVSVDELWETGERIYNLRRAIMVLREDRHRDDDTLSHVWFAGKSRINLKAQSIGLPEPLDEERWEALKDRFYRLRGWSVVTGRPSREKLEALSMMDVADKLEDAGRLG